MKTLKVGVVGGAGRIGTALMKALHADSRFAVFGVCRNSMSAARLVCQGLQARVARTDDGLRLTEATSDLDVLVNCAIPLYGPARTSAAIQRLANSLAVAAAGKHLIHLSSVGVYGDFISNDKALFEDPNPDTTYGRQKLQKENLLRTLSKKHSAKCTILRVGHVYGTELPWSSSILALMKKDGFRLPFDGQRLSNAVWITNLTAAIRELILNQPVPPRLDVTVLNLTDMPQTTWRDIFDLHSEVSDYPTVLPLLPSESERLLRETKKWAETGMGGRLAHETWRWIKHLPGSYIASVPTFKEISQWASSKIVSESLDARLRASNSRRAVRGIVMSSTPGVMPALLSEPVPGPSLAYQAVSPQSGLAELRGWYDAISMPIGPTLTNIS